MVQLGQLVEIGLSRAQRGAEGLVGLTQRPNLLQRVAPHWVCQILLCILKPAVEGWCFLGKCQEQVLNLEWVMRRYDPWNKSNVLDITWGLLKCYSSILSKITFPQDALPAYLPFWSAPEPPEASSCEQLSWTAVGSSASSRQHDELLWLLIGRAGQPAAGPWELWCWWYPPAGRPGDQHQMSPADRHRQDFVNGKLNKY